MTRLINFALLLALFLIVVQGAANGLAATYYVAPSGSDNYPGTLSQPWRTIQKAASALVAGDSVQIRAGTYHEQIKPARSGTDNARITYSSFADEKVIIDGSGIVLGPTDALVQIDGRSFITVTGLVVQKSSRVGVRVTSGTNILLEHLTVMNAGENGIAFYNNSSPSRSVVRNCVVHDVNNAGIVLWNNNGGYFLIQGNVVYNVKGAGNWDGIQAGDTPYTIIKNNTVYGVGSEGDYIDVGGDQTTASSRAHHIVIEGNTVYRDNGGTGWVKLNNRPNRGIVRRNVLQGIGMSFYEQPHANVAIYHNTIVQAYEHALQFWNKDSNAPFGGIKIKNNILAFSDTGTLIQHSPLRQDGSPANILLDGNLFRFSSGNGIEWAMSQANKGYGTSQAEYQRWTAEIGQEPTHGGTYTTAGLAALFVDAAKRDFTPAPTSPSIDRGVALTRTTSAGSGIRIPVKESLYFHDGYGMTQGDLVKVGDNVPVRIVAIDEAADILTVDAPISWKQNDSVNLPYAGAAPDVGATELTGGAVATKLAPPKNLRATAKP